VKGRLKNEVKF